MNARAPSAPSSVEASAPNPSGALHRVRRYYVPSSLRAQVAAEGIESIYDQLESITVRCWPVICPPSLARSLAHALLARLLAAQMAVKDEYQRRGTMLVDVAPLNDQGMPKFFRIILNMPTVQTSDMDYVLDEIESIGESLFADGVPTTFKKDVRHC